MLKNHHLYFEQLKPFLPKYIVKKHEQTIQAVAGRVRNFPEELSKVAYSYARDPSLVTSNLVPLFGVRSRDEERVTQIAASTSFFIMAANMQDDLIDQETRADLAGVYRPFLLRSSTLCVGNAYEILSSYGPKLIPSVNKYLGRMIQGEIDDLDDKNSLESATRNLHDKSGTLGRLCASAGAMIANEDPNEVASAADYGFHLVCALQYLDDFLDFREDFHAGRSTPITITIRQSSSPTNPEAYTEKAFEFTRKEMESHLYQGLEALSKSKVYKSLDELNELLPLILELFNLKGREGFAKLPGVAKFLFHSLAGRKMKNR